ncbi:DUF4287 domain-containing protein [Rhizobium sp. Root1203]|uniref:DUF4287 domain-containing protein n=1 Tax=Rhizobium sp. Root1203 TaxID=1736427 RepID=UPI0009EAF2F3|nr:DUF4287 domain-containing protein [Rhizobium sp. Root1203]
MATDSVKGPASYFPSIEAKYGHPIGYWKDLISGQSGKKHMELVTWLKQEQLDQATGPREIPQRPDIWARQSSSIPSHRPDRSRQLRGLVLVG